jgi:hypothetical protein
MPSQQASQQEPLPLTSRQRLGILIFALSSRIKMAQQKNPLRALCVFAVQNNPVNHVNPV